jgi:hypothetical protein
MLSVVILNVVMLNGARAKHFHLTLHFRARLETVVVPSLTGLYSEGRILTLTQIIRLALEWLVVTYTLAYNTAA